MEATTFERFEVSIPTESAEALRLIIKALKGKVKTCKKCGLDEALEDVKAGRVSGPFNSVDEMWKELMK